MAETEKLLHDLVQQFVGPKPLTPETALLHDLGIGGDDALELFEAVHQRFGTMSEGFEFSNYFPDESEAFAFHVFRRRRASKRRLTFGHLEQVVQRGDWFEP